MSRRHTVFGCSLLLMFVTVAQNAVAQTPAMSPAARAYLDAALDTLESAVIRRDTVSWRSVRDSAFTLAAGAQTTRDTYSAIAWALQRGNKHGFLQAARPGAVHTIVASNIGYVHVPSWSGAGAALADSLQSAITAMAAANVCGWIVDVRGNGGGSMWPMLAGIGPLLGDTIVGAFGSGEDADRWFYKDGLSGILHANGKLDTISRATTASGSLTVRIWC